MILLRFQIAEVTETKMLHQVKYEYNITNNASAITHMWDTLQVKVKSTTLFNANFEMDLRRIWLLRKSWMIYQIDTQYLQLLNTMVSNLIFVRYHWIRAFGPNVSAWYLQTHMLFKWMCKYFFQLNCCGSTGPQDYLYSYFFNTTDGEVGSFRHLVSLNIRPLCNRVRQDIGAFSSTKFVLLLTFCS